MSRLLTLPVLFLLAPAAAAQIPAPYDKPPGYGLTWGPRPGLFYPPAHRHPHHGHAGHPGYYPRPTGFGFGAGYTPLGFTGPVIYPGWGGYYGGGVYGGAGPTVVVENYVTPPAAPAPAAAPLDPAYLSSALAARRAAATAAAAAITTGVTLTLPAAGEVWVNGVKQPGDGPTFDLAVANAKPGESVPFAITARWQADGQTFESTQELTVPAGTKRGLTVFRGSPVRAEGDKVTSGKAKG